MLKNRLLLGSVAFGISFSISLITGQTLGMAGVTGLITVPSTLIAVFVSDRRSERQAQTRLAQLKRQIRALHQKRNNLLQSLEILEVEREQLEADFYSWQDAVDSLQSQNAPAPAQKMLSWNLAALNALPPAPEAPDQLLLPASQELESSSLALKQIHVQVAEQRQLKAQLNQELGKLKQQKSQLEAQTAHFQTQIQGLEKRQAELNQAIADLSGKRQAVEQNASPLKNALQQLQAQVSSLRGELGQLESEILDRRTHKDQLEQEIAQLTTQKYLAPKATASVSVPETDKPETSTELPREWTELMVQLPEHELQVIKVLAEHRQPSPILKKIADDNRTVPELLIDAINNRSLKILGDKIITSGFGNDKVAIAKQHLKHVKQLLKTYEYLTQ
ncbi:MAG: hypothetical protein VKJ46_04975 [Leptolyngbyaceae bacterium]|nr:hypothetical protein [Leptolyngbyaceae bacterium]